MGYSTVEVQSNDDSTSSSDSNMNISWEVIPLYVDSDKDGVPDHPDEPVDSIDAGTLDFPKLEFPPPDPSASYIMKKVFFERCKSLSDVDTILIDALEANGYQESRYFSVPNGFALVTRLEKINSDGTSKQIPERWDGNSDINISSFSEYFKTLLFGSKGYYRLLVFIITDKSFKTSKTGLSKNQAESWYLEGNFTLPNIIGKIKFTDEHKIYSLIYEFTKTDSSNATLNLPSKLKLTGLNHLTQSKILIWILTHH